MAREFILSDIASGTPQAFFKSGNITAVSLGRVEGANVVIPDSTISRSHAEFLAVGSEWVVRDLGSTNGTMVNGLMLPEHEFFLIRTGDLIQCGDIEFEFSVPDEKKLVGQALFRHRIKYLHCLFLRGIRIRVSFRLVHRLILPMADQNQRSCPQSSVRRS